MRGKKHINPRCADCGSSDIVLEGQGVWDASIRGWVIVSPNTQEVDGAVMPIDDTENFFCANCVESVGVLMG